MGINKFSDLEIFFLLTDRKSCVLQDTIILSASEKIFYLKLYIIFRLKLHRDNVSNAREDEESAPPPLSALLKTPIPTQK